VHYKRGLYVLEDSIENRRLRGAPALLSEAEDGTLTIRANGRVLASRLHPKDQARLAPGAVVDHKRLDGVKSGHHYFGEKLRCELCVDSTPALAIEQAPDLRHYGREVSLGRDSLVRD
jgi:hypothetical protein